MKTISLALLALALASACRGPDLAGDSSAAVESTARPEVRYYAIADT